jgi:Tfp pilus assembly protein PilW
MHAREAGNPRRQGVGAPMGMTLVEIMVASTIFIGMVVAVFAVLRTSSRLARTGETLVDLQEYGRKALEAMVEDLRLAGRTTLPAPNGKTYPRLGNFSDQASANPGILTHAGTPRKKYAPDGCEGPGCGVPAGYGGTVPAAAQDTDLRNLNIFFHHGLDTLADGYNDHMILSPSDPDYQTYGEASREIIFVLPAGVLTGNPTYAGSTAVWDPTEYAYVVTQGSDGINQLEKRTWNPTDLTYSRNVIARYVERLQVEDSGAEPDLNDDNSNLTSNQLRLTLFLAKKIGTEQTILRTKVTTVVVMRNSELD